MTHWLGRLRDRSMLYPSIALAATGFAVGIGTGIALGRVDDRPPTSSDSAGTSAQLRSEDSDGANELGPLNDLEEINRSLPVGFHAAVYAENVPYPTSLAADGRGRLFVGSLVDDMGVVFRFEDEDSDGVLDPPTRFAEGFKGLTGVLSLGRDVYVASRGTIAVVRDLDDDGRAESRRDIVRDLPAVFPVHSNNGLVVGPDGRLYFGVGATCNGCAERNPMAATVVRCTIAGSDCTVFASGLRNVYDLAFHPLDGTLFGADNGGEAIGGAKLEIEDELNHIRKNGRYGWPFCWGKSRGLDCGGTVPAVAEFAPHSAPAGLVFYTGRTFPRLYWNNLFVTLWGDTGRRVVRMVLRKNATGRYTARSHDFLRSNRPVDIINGPDGSLLVADSDGGKIYRITYRR